MMLSSILLLLSVILLHNNFVNGSGGFYPSFAIDDLRKSHYIFDEKCPKLVDYIFAHQRKCAEGEGGQEVAFICIHFSTDVEFLLSSVLHHLLLGFRQIYIYNNDHHLPWFYHPLVACLVSAELLIVQPWFGDGAQVPAYDHCCNQIELKIKDEVTNRDSGFQISGGHKSAIPIPTVSNDNTWIAVFDIDEYLVLHQDQCVQSFLHRLQVYNAPAIAINWAFFIPSLPFSKMGITQTNDSHPYVTLPFESITTRMYQNSHIKTIARLTCLNKWQSSHYASYYKKCKFFGPPIDPLGRQLKNFFLTPYVGNDYPVAQLNHYWTLSVYQYLRKIHRGRGYGFDSRAHYRSTNELFAHLRGNQNSTSGDLDHKRVIDTNFTKYYGARFLELQQICSECLNVSYFYPNHIKE